MAGTRTSTQRFYGATVAPTTPGTGGGTGGGGVASGGGYDRYIGTLGAAANAPVGSKFPHYTSFPAGEKHDWLRVVSTFSPNNKVVVKHQKWMCTTKTGKDTPANWELIQQNTSPSLRSIASISRYLDNSVKANITIPTNVFSYVPLLAPIVTGDYKVYSDTYRTDVSSWFTDPDQTSCLLDLSVFVQFSFHPNNSRNVFLSLGMFYDQPPPGTYQSNGAIQVGSNVLGPAILSDGTTDESNESEGLIVPASAIQAPTNASAGLGAFADTYLLDVFPGLQFVFYMKCYQTSGVNLTLEVARMNVRLYANE